MGALGARVVHLSTAGVLPRRGSDDARGRARGWAWRCSSRLADRYGRGARGMASPEGLDDHHGRPAAGTRTGLGRGPDRLVRVGLGALGYGDERGERDGEQRTSAREVRHPRGIGQEAVVADAVKSRYALQCITGFMRSNGLCGECC
jgi:hypothetical protein